MNASTKNKKQLRKKILFSLILVSALIAFRIYLPTLAKNYINKALADIPGYYGQITDIDIALIRGAYVIKGLYLNKVNAKTQVPFLNFPTSDISVEWKSLFKGKVVSEVYMYDPEVIYVLEDMTSSVDSTSEEDWTKALTDIIPLDINHFEIQNGKIAYVEAQADPTINLQINNIALTATNLRNIVAKKRTLPSSITATGSSIGNGDLSLKGNINLLKKVPDMDISFSLDNINITALNDFTRHFAKIDTEKGDLGIFSEFAIADGFMKGYFKLLMADTKFIGAEDGVLEKIWEGLAGFFKMILKNQNTGAVAVKAPLEGDLNNIQTAVLPAIGSIFKNAFIKAFKDGIDEEIEYKDAFVEKNIEDEEEPKWFEFRKKRKLRKAQKENAIKNVNQSDI